MTEMLLPIAAPARRWPQLKRTRNLSAILILVVPFGVLFLAFYIVPIIYAIWESLQVIHRSGTYGPPVTAFGGLSQYVLVFQNSEFWASIGRVLLFGVIQVPIMLGLALLFACWTRPSLKARSSFDSRSSPRTPFPVSSRPSCGATSTRRASRRSRY
jgi:multiple sugar transport system permease protein